VHALLLIVVVVLFATHGLTMTPTLMRLANSCSSASAITPGATAAETATGTYPEKNAH
jgi:hypothetical protein